MLLEQMFELETVGLDQMSIKFLSDGLGSQAEKNLIISNSERP